MCASKNQVVLATLAALSAGGPPSAPPRTVVLRERELYEGSDTQRRFERNREERRARKRAQKEHELELAGQNLKTVLAAEKAAGIHGRRMVGG